MVACRIVPKALFSGQLISLTFTDMHKTLTILNFSIIGYFAVLYLSYIFKIDFQFLGMIRELLTIPAMLGQLVLIVLGVVSFFRKESSPLFIVSWIMLLICAVLTIGSFF